MTVANELDGLLGCLSDTITASASSSTYPDLHLLFGSYDKALETSADSQGKEEKLRDARKLLLSSSSSSSSLSSSKCNSLGQVINTVDLLMGHSSSIVRQHAGQVFLKLYYQLPEEIMSDDDVNETKMDSDEKGHFKSNKKTEEKKDNKCNEINNKKSIYTVGSKEQILQIISISILDNKKWQRQEISLIISEEIINKKLSEYMNEMKNKNWERKKLSKSFHNLLLCTRSSSSFYFLHPMFEIRRMHGQILPIISRATIFFQPDYLINELISCNNISNNMNDNEFDRNDFHGLSLLVVPLHLLDSILSSSSCSINNHIDITDKNCNDKDINYSDNNNDNNSNNNDNNDNNNNDNIDTNNNDNNNSYILNLTLNGDCRAVILNAWISALCKAAEHIIELDIIGTNSNFQLALQRKNIINPNNTSLQSTGYIMTSWAIEMNGRLSEENSMKEYSEALKLILYGGSKHAYDVLAESLFCVKNILFQFLGLFWSYEFVNDDHVRMKENDNAKNSIFRDWRTDSMVSKSTAAGENDQCRNDNKIVDDDKNMINNSDNINDNSLINDDNDNIDNDIINDNYNINMKNNIIIRKKKKYPFSEMRKIHIPESISCDFIDAAALSASFLQKIDNEMFQEILMKNEENFSFENDENHININKNLKKRNSFHDVIFSDDIDYDIENNKKNQDMEINQNENNDKYKYNECLKIPIFLFSLRAVTRLARDMLSHASIIHRNSSCRSASVTSPIKMNNIQHCQINMDWYRNGNNSNEKDVNKFHAKHNKGDDYHYNNIDNNNNNNNNNSSNKNSNNDNNSRTNSITSFNTTNTNNRNSFLSESDDGIERKIENENENEYEKKNNTNDSTRNLLEASLFPSSMSYMNTTPSKRFSMIDQTSKLPTPSLNSSFHPPRRLSLNLPHSCIPKNILVVSQTNNFITSNLPIFSSNYLSDSKLNSTYWSLLPSITDPMTDFSKGILNVESSVINSHRWLCESLAPVLPCLGTYDISGCVLTE